MGMFRGVLSLVGVSAVFGMVGCTSNDFTFKKVKVPVLCKLENGNIVPAPGASCEGVGTASTSSGSGGSGSGETGSGGSGGSPQGTPPPSGNYASKMESFPIADYGIRKIDLVFVVDDSQSMQPYQAKLADGFSAISESYFRRADLDICVAVISSSRYLGRIRNSKATEYPGIGCTKPVGFSDWTEAQRNSYIDSLIASFKTSVNVGLQGSGSELLGKSLVTFMRDSSTWSTLSNTGSHTFFRAGAVTNISFLTDENNFYRYPNATETDAFAESKNDLPARSSDAVFSGVVSGNLNVFSIGNTLASILPASITAAFHQTTDDRMGLQNHLDSFFLGLNPGAPLSYSVTTLLSSNPSAYGIPSKAQNLEKLREVVGRDSNGASIDAPASGYSSLYSNVLSQLVNRSYSFTLASPVHSGVPNPISVSLIKANGLEVVLASPTDFELSQDRKTVRLKDTSSTLSGVGVGDRISVNYSYLLP
jgi:hypothetical protein